MKFALTSVMASLESCRLAVLKACANNSRYFNKLPSLFFSMHYYDRLAAGYNELHEEEQLKKLQVLLKHVTFRGKILDVGAGTCLVARHLDKNIQCISVDSSKEMLAKGVGERHVAKAESLPFSNGIFDGVISLTALHHADFQQALAEIKRVARP